MHKISLSLIFCALLAPTAAFANQECPKEIGNAHECNLYREKLVLKKYPATFKREGEKLAIYLKRYTSRYYCDTLASSPIDDSSEYGAYALTDYFPESGYAAIKNIGHERGHTILLNLKNGLEYFTYGNVIESPNKKSFFVWNIDIDEYAGENQLEILRVTPCGLVREFYLKPKDWAASSPVWKDNNRITFIIKNDTGNAIGAKSLTRSKNNKPNWMISNTESHNTASAISHDNNP